MGLAGYSVMAKVKIEYRFQKNASNSMAIARTTEINPGIFDNAFHSSDNMISFCSILMCCSTSTLPPLRNKISAKND